MPESLETLLELDTFNSKMKRLIEPRRNRSLTPAQATLTMTS
jgi:hypothetical protein